MFSCYKRLHAFTVTVYNSLQFFLHVFIIVSYTCRMYLMTTGQRIKLAREKKGWTQTELAKQVGVTAQSVQQWEDPEAGARPRPSRLKTVAKALGVTESWLLCLSGDVTPLTDNLDLDELARCLSAVLQADRDNHGNTPVKTLVDLAIVAYRLRKSAGSDDVVSELMRLTRK